MPEKYSSLCPTNYQTPGRTHSRYELVHSREPGSAITKYHQLRREVIMQKKEKKAPTLAEQSLNEEEAEGKEGKGLLTEFTSGGGTMRS